MLIKVCGMRNPSNISAVKALGIDLMGFIFWEKSPRKAPSHPFQEMESKDRIQNPSMKTVGVFVDETPQNVMAKINEFQLDYVQLHGHETAAYIDNLRQSLLQTQDKPIDTQIIKALSIREAEDVERWKEYKGHVDMLLFDTKCTCVGGSGEQFDWSVLNHYDGDIPFLLSGGIGPDDVEKVIAFHHPYCVGIDLNSKFEDAPGLKNIDKLRNFIKTIRK